MCSMCVGALRVRPTVVGAERRHVTQLPVIQSAVTVTTITAELEVH